MNEQLLAHLNPAQREAVLHIDGPLLILAGPGSGKTRVVTHRVAHLLEQGIQPRDILALTFTNKAADEMRARLAQLAPNQPVWVGTFHRFCATLLRRFAAYVGLSENYSILDVADSGRLLAEAITDANVELSMLSPDTLAHSISWAKNQLISPERYRETAGGPWQPVVEKVYPAYQRRLLQANSVDFDDLLMHIATILREQPEIRRSLDHRYRYILVDEYQDTNLAQYAIVRALSVDYPNLAVTGDPDQSIYGWRGATINNILEFEHDYPNVRVVRLEQNYRSTPNILAVADELIRHNRQRKAKSLFTDNPPGKPVRMVMFPSHLDETDAIAGRIAADLNSGRRRPTDFAIFYRTNALSRTLEHALTHHHVPYQIVHGVEFYQRKEVRDLIAYLQLVNNPANDAALLRIINTPTRGIGKTTVTRLGEHARRRGIPLLEAARESGVVDGLNARASLSVARFVTLFDKLRERATAPVEEILGLLLELTGYRSALEASEDSEDLERLDNIQELLTAAREFDMNDTESAPLERFLEQSALVGDTDNLDTAAEKITMMTLHAAKGLEFPVVFIVALEEGILPHQRCLEDSRQLEEERRLLFVGITRAREELQISLAEKRDFRGVNRATVPSQFLMELPRAEMEVVERPRWGRAADGDFADNSSRQDAADEYAEYFHDPDRENSFEAYAVDEAAEPTDDAAEASSRMRRADDDDGFESDFDPDSPADRRWSRGTRPKKNATNRSAGPSESATSGTSSERFPKLTVASALLTGSQVGPPRIPPDAFVLGMLVQHPEYGAGKIVALAREGAKRTARVEFFADRVQRQFVLLYADLRPIQSDSRGSLP